jgi:hypothetical protein
LEIVNIVNIEPDALEQVTLLPAKAGPTSATPTAATETGVVKAKTMANSLTQPRMSTPNDPALRRSSTVNGNVLRGRLVSNSSTAADSPVHSLLPRNASVSKV